MGVNADGCRELLGIKVGDSETEAFWAQFISHLKERGLSDVFARKLLPRVPKAHQGMVTAALRSVFAQETAADILNRWDDLAASLAERFPNAAALMDEAREDVLAHSCGEDFVYRHFPQAHWRKIWSTNLLERVNEEIKRRTRVVGIFVVL